MLFREFLNTFDENSNMRKIVTVQQAYAFTADAVRKRRFNRNKSITEGDFAWICSRNYEGTEQLRMNNMFHNGIPHEVALPLLMTYMGHATLSETGKYLKLTAEAFPDLIDQINKIYGSIMPDLEVKTEYEEFVIEKLYIIHLMTSLS